MPRNTPLRKFIKMTGRDPLKMSEKQRDKVSSSSRYKQWISLNRTLRQAKKLNSHNPNLKEFCMKIEENTPKVEIEEDQLDENKFAGWNERTLHRHLLDNGFKPDGGSKHGGYVHVKTGRKIKPVPRHKGDYPPGLVKGIFDSMKSVMGLSEDSSPGIPKTPEPKFNTDKLSPKEDPNDFAHDANLKTFNNKSNVFKTKPNILKVYKKAKKRPVKPSTLLPVNKIKSELEIEKLKNEFKAVFELM